MSLRHALKILPGYYVEILNGNKTFEIREAKDRYFSIGDVCTLNEYEQNSPEDGCYTGRFLDVRIKYITTYMQQKGYVVFGFELTNIY